MHPFPFVTVENERVMYGGNDPAALRRRMLPTDNDRETGDYEVSGDVLLGALRALDPDSLVEALNSFSDDECRYLSDLMFDSDED